MYGNFELLKKSMLIILFWSGVSYILETRKIGTSFSGTAIETIIGWCLFLAIICIFLLIVTTTETKTTNERKKRITHEVEEDGMTFTVGGHLKNDEVLPQKYLIESDVLNKYSLSMPQSELIENALNKSIVSVKELLVDISKPKAIQEAELFDKTEGDGKAMYGENVESRYLSINQPVESIKNLKGFVSQSEKDIEEDANAGYVEPSVLSNDDERRAINKGLFFYKTQFNALLSYVVNHDLYKIENDIRVGKILILDKYPKNPKDEIFAKKRILTKKQYQAKRDAIIKKSENLRKKIDDSLDKIIQTLPQYTYKGIETTTPQIKNKRELDLSQYQLVIFLALFDYAPWIVIRSNLALNMLSDSLKERLSKNEIDALSKAEAGLSIRDKRVLFNARRMYDIYIKRDKEIESNGTSSYSMTFKYNSEGEKVNTLEEAVALCELLRKANTVKFVEARKEVNRNVGGLPYNEGDLINIMSKLLHQKDIFNTSNTERSLGGIKNDLIYINYDLFVPRFNGMFAEKYPNYANQQTYMEVQKMLYSRLKKMGLLAMRMKKTSANLETYEFLDNGELLSVFWDFGKAVSSFTTENGLIIHAAQMFKDIVPMNQETSGTPKIIDISKSRAIPLTKYEEKIKKLIEQAKIEKRKHHTAMEMAAKQQQIEEEMKAKAEKELAELDKMISAENETAAQETAAQQTAAQETAAQQRAAQQVLISESDEGEKKALSTTDILAKKVLDSLSIDIKNAGFNQNNHRNNMIIENADKFIDNVVQVLKLRLTTNNSDQEINKGDSKKGGRKYDYYIKQQDRNREALLTYSRKTVNEYAAKIDMTIIKLMMNANSQYKIDNVFRYSRSDRKIIIKHDAIPRIFNVYEQLALYQKKGKSNVWGVKETELKVDGKRKKSDQRYDVINAIECIQFDESKEDTVYKQIADNLWNEEKAKELMEKFTVSLSKNKHLFKQKNIAYERKNENIKNDFAVCIIPKSTIGTFNRMGLEVNSFLGYIDQKKKTDSLDPKLNVFSEQLFASELNKVPVIYFKTTHDL